MSYILEALRKSDAERERGAVPDLHAQPLTLAGAEEAAAPGPGRFWLWLAVAAVLLLAAALAWRLTLHDAPPVLAAAPARPPVAAPSPPPAVSTLPQVAPTIASAPLPASAPLAEPAPARMQTSTQTPPAKPTHAATPTPEPEAKSARKPVPRVRARPAAPTAAAATAAKKPAAPQPAERVPLLAELPDDLRRQVPAMVIGGSVYSPQPASRMLIVNGQVYREGSPVAPELQLDQIGTKAAVFSIRGKRFEVPL